MSLEITTDATWEPVTLDEAKLFARIDIDDDDALVTALITAARQEAELQCQRTIPAKTLSIVLPCFPLVFRLLLPPVVSVSSIKYYDTDNDQQTVDSDDYLVRAYADGGLVTLVDGASWPSSVYDRPDAVTIEYVAGYASQALVPEAIKTYIKIMVSTMYDLRTAEVQGTITSATKFVPRILDPYRLINV